MIKMISTWHFSMEYIRKPMIPADIKNVFGHVMMLLFFTLPGITQAQNWQLDPGSAPEVVVTGTSTLHDWKATCSGVAGVPETLNIADQTIKKFEFKVPVDSMDGGRGATMNNKIRTAFNAAEHPFINFRQTEPAVLSGTPESGKFDFTSKGILSLAGKEKSITVSGKGTVKDGFMTLTASKELKMTDFEMEPPSAMFGQIKTNDDIVVHFAFHYKQTGNE